MATIGLSKPYYAIYKNSDTTVTYSGLAVLAKAVDSAWTGRRRQQHSLGRQWSRQNLQSSFLAVPMIHYHRRYSPEAGAAILGLTLQTVTNEDISTATPQEMVFGESQTIPYLGFGVVIKKQQNNIMKYMGLVLPKIQFSNPGISCNHTG